MTPFQWLLVGVVVLSIAASFRAILDHLSTPQQKILQIIFVWLVPIAGALFTFSILRNTSPRKSSLLRRFLPASLASAAFGTEDSDRNYAAGDWGSDDGGGSSSDGGGGGGDGGSG